MPKQNVSKQTGRSDQDPLYDEGKNSNDETYGASEFVMGLPKSTFPDVTGHLN